MKDCKCHIRPIKHCTFDKFCIRDNDLNIDLYVINRFAYTFIIPQRVGVWTRNVTFHMLLSIGFKTISKRNQFQIDMAQISKEICLWAIKFVFSPLCAILNYPKKIPIFFQVNVNEFFNIFQITRKPKAYLL